jgi:hypothetical protein
MHDDNSHRIGGPTNGCHSDINPGFCVYPLPAGKASRQHRIYIGDTELWSLYSWAVVCVQTVGTFLAGPGDLGQGAAERMSGVGCLETARTYTSCHSHGNLNGHRCTDGWIDELHISITLYQLGELRLIEWYHRVSVLNRSEVISKTNSVAISRLYPSRSMEVLRKTNRSHAGNSAFTTWFEPGTSQMQIKSTSISNFLDVSLYLSTHVTECTNVFTHVYHGVEFS